jgi:hypothetical protein
MGVQSLKLQLAKHSRPQLVTLPAGGGGGHPDAAGATLLVDGPSLEAHLLSALGAAGAGASPDAAAAVYNAACAYVRRLQATGLKVVAAVAAASAPPGRDAAAAVAARAAVQAGAASSPAARWALAAALADSGAEVHVAASSTTRLLLGYYRRHAPSVFALLTDNADFFVLGVRGAPDRGPGRARAQRTRAPSRAAGGCTF